MLTGASVALTACQRNVEHALVSQYQMPEYKLPGQALYWATTCGECIGGCGLAAKTTDGRVIKLDGLPEHPVSRGAVCARGQSALQVAYHPNRLNHFSDGNGKKVDKTWATVYGESLTREKVSKPLFITRSLRGTLGGLMVDLARALDGKIWVVDYPARLAERQVIKSLTGKAELPHYALEEADYAVTFGGDLLNVGHSSVHSNWAYGQFRQGKNRQRGTLVSVSSRINMTAANADRWLAVRPGTEGWVALAVGNLLAAQGKGPWPAWASQVSLEKVISVTGLEEGLIRRLAARLAEAKKPLCIADSDAGNYVNGVDSLYIIHSLNKMLRGSLDTFEPENVLGVEGAVPAGLVLNTEAALKGLNEKAFEAAWIFDVDVVRILPASLKVGDALGNASRRVAFSTFTNETTALCQLVVPIYNWLEDWGDQRITGSGLDIYNVQQPVITPLWGEARSLGDILAAVKAGDPIALTGAGEGAKPDAIKGKNLLSLIRGEADSQRWETLLARGGAWKEASLDWELYPNRVSAPPPVLADPGKPPKAVNPFESLPAAQVNVWSEAVTEGPVLVPFASVALRDGSLGNRPWMQELPDPISTAVWGAWVEMNPDTADKLKLKRHDLVRITVEGGGEPIVAPVMPLPSVHPDTIAVPVGDEKPDYSKWSDPNYVDFGMGNKVFGRYGYTNANYGKGGVNPLKALKADTRSGDPQWVGNSVKLEKVGKAEMITAMDIRVFNLPRQILPFE